MIERLKRWLMRLFEPRTPQPYTPVVSLEVQRDSHDPVFQEDRDAYEHEKQEINRRNAERIARVKRLGYDLDNVTRKGAT